MNTARIFDHNGQTLDNLLRLGTPRIMSFFAQNREDRNLRGGNQSRNNKAETDGICLSRCISTKQPEDLILLCVL